MSSVSRCCKMLQVFPTCARETDFQCVFLISGFFPPELYSVQGCVYQEIPTWDHGGQLFVSHHHLTVFFLPCWAWPTWVDFRSQIHPGSMRLYARRAGFSLSDHGICEASHARGVGRGQRLWTGPPIAQQQFLEEKDWWNRVMP